MAGLSFWAKYILLCAFLAFCDLGWVCSAGFLGTYVFLDLLHEELLERKTRKEILHKACLRRIDKIIREEKRNLNRGS